MQQPIQRFLWIPIVSWLPVPLDECCFPSFSRTDTATCGSPAGTPPKRRRKRSVISQTPARFREEFAEEGRCGQLNGFVRDQAEEWVLDENLAAMFARTDAKRSERRRLSSVAKDGALNPPEDALPVQLAAVPLGGHSAAILLLSQRLETVMSSASAAPLWPKEAIYCT